MLVILLMILLQAEPRKLSAFTIVMAALAVALAVSLLVVFYRKFKSTEKEPEEDWQSAMHSLFTPSQTAERKVVDASGPDVSAVEPVGGTITPPRETTLPSTASAEV